MASEDKVQKEALELLQEEVDLARTSLHIVAEKISNMELRQSVSSGLGNDAIRAMHQWAVAESASLSSMAVSTVVNMIEAGRKATYYENFMHKDLRRGQFEVCKLFHQAIMKSSFDLTENQNAMGETFIMMPCTREVIEARLGKKLEPLPEALEKLYKLVMPLDRGFQPHSVQTLIEYKALPEHYEGCYKDISEEEARRIWAEVCELEPSLKIIEGIPLNDKGKKTWREALMSKIVKHNQHFKAVYVAEKFIEASESMETYEQTKKRQEDAKRSEQLYQKALTEFWTEHDARGSLMIERAEKKKAETSHWLETIEPASKKAKSDDEIKTTKTTDVKTAALSSPMF